MELASSLWLWDSEKERGSVVSYFGEYVNIEAMIM